MKVQREKTDILVLEANPHTLTELRRALHAVRIPHTIIFFSNITQLTTYLSSDQKKSILFLPIRNNYKKGIAATITTIRNKKDLSIAIYDPLGIVTNIEELFALGANVYINKPQKGGDLLLKIKQVMMVNAQFAAENFNNDTYFLSV